MFFSDGRTIRVEKSDHNYAKIVKTFELPQEEQEKKIDLILSPQENGKEIIHGKDGFEVIEDSVYYNGDKLPQALEDKVLSIVRDGLPLEHFSKFWERLEKNPSSTSVNELIDFLSYKELPITEDGCFLAYKGINDDYYSVHGNTNTKVVNGKVDDAGRIFNGIGEVIEVRRRDVDDNRSHHCSHGLHVGSLNYAKNWGPRVVLVKVDPADVVSVPSDCSCQKCRVSKYEVIKDFSYEIMSSVVDEDGDDLVPDDEKNRQEFIAKVSNYLENKKEEGLTEVTVRQIQNSFSPIWPSRESVLDALQELWYDWNEDYIVALNQ